MLFHYYFSPKRYNVKPKLRNPAILYPLPVLLNLSYFRPRLREGLYVSKMTGVPFAQSISERLILKKDVRNRTGEKEQKPSRVLCGLIWIRRSLL